MSEHENHFVPAGDGTYVVVLEEGCLECAEHAVRHAMTPAPVDWPARFRAAADVAAEKGEHSAGFDLSVFASDLEAMPSHVVEDIGRALGGEKP